MSEQAFIIANKLPRVVAGVEPDIMLLHPIKVGRADGKPIFVFKKGLLYKLHVSGWGGPSLILECDNVDTLEKYFAAFYAPIEWA